MTVFRAFLLIGGAFVVYGERRSVISMYSELRADDQLDILAIQSYTTQDLQQLPPFFYWVSH